MQIEKLNDNQIRCIIDSSDLNRHNIKMKDLAYGSSKTSALFKEILQQAVSEVGFNTNNYPLMIEAIPLSENNLQIVITKVEDPDELDVRFSKFTSETTEPISTVQPSNNGPDDLLNLFKKFKELADKTIPEPTVKHTAPLVAYIFNNIEDILTVAKAVSVPGTLKTTLYKDNSQYYLLIENTVLTEDFSRVFTILKEYCTKELTSESLKSYLSEHCTIIIKNKALNKLAKF